MKYYFPTSTLNFDCILSSQKVFPPAMYKSGTLWWNQFERTIGDVGNAIVLYPRCPIWTIDDPERDNYPMVVEVDQVFKKSDFVDVGGMRVLLLHRPLEISQLDLAQGKVRFLFRNETERNRTINKAFIGVSECKVSVAMEVDHAAACDLIPTARAKTCDLVAVGTALHEKLAEFPGGGEVCDYTGDDYRGERERGAELGYQIGRFVKALRTGSFLDSFLIPMSFSDWRTRVLPKPFSLILEKFFLRGAEPWDPNRAALVDLCRDIWFDCFNGKKLDGREIKAGTSIHASLQLIAQHWASPEIGYRVGSEKNVYMQAFAAFLECGTTASKYYRYACDSNVKCPEYIFALYGAVVGYTFFSRALLDVRHYSENRFSPCSQSLQLPVEIRSECVQKDVGCRETGREGCCICQDETTKSSRPKTTVGSAGSGRKSDFQPDLFDVANTNQKGMSRILVDDPSLMDAVRSEFSHMSSDRLDSLIRVLGLFSGKYSREGYYGMHPDGYPRSNPALIQHLLNCMDSVHANLRDLHFSWDTPEEKHRFEAFLGKRYVSGGPEQ